MSFRSLRERKHLSQEKLAESSGLSLRTIQRLEAGHRVSYASLRSLAATFDMDVDQLERELYAMKQSDDFVEIPRWVRLWTDGRWMGAPPMSRWHAHVQEAICIGLGIALLSASFFIPTVATELRVAGAFALACGYLVSVGVRTVDAYKLWPATETAMPGPPPPRSLPGTIGFYAFVLLVLALFWGLVFLLAD